MSSSISSSRPARSRAIRAVLIALIGMLALEAFSRGVLLRTSKDFRRFFTYSNISRSLMSESGFRVVFIGNSYTGEGVDEEEFCRTVSPTMGPTFAAKLTADSSYATTWYYMLNHYFWRHGKAPEMAVFNFQTSWLADGKNEDFGRLALAFSSRADWGEILSSDFKTTGERAEYLVSSQWVTYAIRDRLRERTLSLFVPGYREYVSRVHNINRRLAKGGSPKNPTYRSLHRLLRRARAKGTRLCFVAGPAIQKYEVDAAVIALIKSESADFLDLREIPEIDARSFRDGIHLTAVGRNRYTRRLAREIVALQVNKQKTPESAVSFRLP